MRYYRGTSSGGIGYVVVRQNSPCRSGVLIPRGCQRPVPSIFDSGDGEPRETNREAAQGGVKLCMLMSNQDVRAGGRSRIQTIHYCRKSQPGEGIHTFGCWMHTKSDNSRKFEV